MNKIVSFIFGTLIGAAVGSVVTIKVMDIKYQEKYEQEVDMVKQAFKKLQNKTRHVAVESDVNKDEISGDAITDKDSKKSFMKEYKNLIQKKNYQKYYNGPKDEASNNDEEETCYYDEAEEKLVGDGVPDEEEWKEELAEEEPAIAKKPYLITPDEVGEKYKTEMLIYFEDGILTDDDYNEEDIKSTIGLENINSFGKYERDSLFVRNEYKRIDYEVHLDNRRYEDII